MKCHQQMALALHVKTSSGYCTSKLLRYLSSVDRVGMAVFNIAGLKIDVHYGELP